MNVEIYGQEAVDTALSAMRSHERVYLFGNQYIVTKVAAIWASDLDCIKGEIELRCMSRPMSKSMKVLVEGSHE